MSELQRLNDVRGIERYSRSAARSMGRSKAVSQVRQARVVDEADVALEKLEQATYLTVNAAMALTKVAGAIKQFEEQSGGDMALAARLQRMGDRHEWIVGESIEDFRRDVRRK
jgi:hypothetical protein